MECPPLCLTVVSGRGMVLTGFVDGSQGWAVTYWERWWEGLTREERKGATRVELVLSYEGGRSLVATGSPSEMVLLADVKATGSYSRLELRLVVGQPVIGLDVEVGRHERAELV